MSAVCYGRGGSGGRAGNLIEWGASGTEEGRQEKERVFGESAQRNKDRSLTLAILFDSQKESFYIEKTRGNVVL